MVVAAGFCFDGVGGFWRTGEEGDERNEKRLRESILQRNGFSFFFDILKGLSREMAGIILLKSWTTKLQHLSLRGNPTVESF